MKYGIENFEVTIVATCFSLEMANFLESCFIKKYDTFKNGFNLTSGGGRCDISEETRMKMSQANKGRTVSEETRTKISQANKGKKRSEESRVKMSQARKGKIPSEETRMKISQAAKGRFMIQCEELSTGIVKILPSCEVEKEYNFSKTTRNKYITLQQSYKGILMTRV